MFSLLHIPPYTYTCPSACLHSLPNPFTLTQLCAISPLWGPGSHSTHCLQWLPASPYPTGLGPGGPFRAAGEITEWTKPTGLDTRGLLQVQKPHVSSADRNVKNMPTFLYKFASHSSICTIHSDISLFHTFAILFPIYLYYVFVFSFLENVLSFHQCRGKEKRERIC